MASLASSPVHMEIPIRKLTDIIRLMLIREIVFKQPEDEPSKLLA